MKKSSLVVLATVVLIGAGIAYWWASSGVSDAGKAKLAPPVPVLLAKATARDLPVVLEVVGRAEAYESVTLRARVDGQVASVVFTEGQHVKQGDELLRLDAADFVSRLRQAEANVAKDEAQLAKAKADTLRYVALRDRNFVSEEKVNEMRTTEASAAATLRADQAGVELARSQLSYATIRAPFAGVLGAKLVFPGGTVKTNDTVLAVINRVQPLYVTFSVPEKHLPQLRREMARGGACKQGTCLRVGVTIPGDRGRRFAGEARFIDNAVDAATGTIVLKAVLDNKDEALTPGQFLNVTLNLDTLTNSVVVPNEAVQQGPEGPFVYLVNQEDVAEVRKIEVVTSFSGLTAIGKGLQTGDTVVTDGQLRLTPGAKVVARAQEAKPDTPDGGAKK